MMLSLLNAVFDVMRSTFNSELLIYPVAAAVISALIIVVTRTLKGRG